MDLKWLNPLYRGKSSEKISIDLYDFYNSKLNLKSNEKIYPEHNKTYLRKCLKNLYNKNINLYPDFQD